MIKRDQYRSTNMKIYVFLFTIIWCRMSDGYIRSSICVDGDNQVIKDQKQCESCFCENILTNNNCSLKFCPCLKMLCSNSSELRDSIQKLRTKNKSSSDMKKKKNWLKDLYNADKHNRDDIIYGVDINSDLTKTNERYKRDTEQERELSNPILERYFGMNQLIRLMSIDYQLPATQSESDQIGVLVMIMYSIIVVIGITICLLVYKKCSYHKKERRRTVDKPIQGCSMNNDDLESDNQQAATVTKFLLDKDLPTYEECMV